MVNSVPTEPASPPQEEHNGVDSHNGDGEEDSGNDDDPVAPRVGHQDVRRNFGPEGQEAIHAWAVGRGGSRESSKSAPSPL